MWTIFSLPLQYIVSLWQLTIFKYFWYVAFLIFIFSLISRIVRGSY